MTEIERRLATLRQEEQAELGAIPPMTRAEAYAAGHYVIPRELFSGPTGNWTNEDWMKVVKYTVRLTD